MNKFTYIGFRIEVPSRAIKNAGIINRFNKKHNNVKLFDLHKSGKIVIEKDRNMIFAKGDDLLKSQLANFSILFDIRKIKEAERIVQIINVLGNDKLIKERVSLFVKGNSLLNAISELNIIKESIIDLNNMIPELVKSGFYYAPDATSLI
jgi:hypothetical protein